MKIIERIFIMCACIFLLGCSTSTAPNRSVQVSAGNNRLAPCPTSPNCVSSMESMDDRYVEPLRYSGKKDTAYHKLIGLIETQPRARIVVKEANYLKAEFRSAILRFVDDVEFLLSAEQPVIDVRSASRVGHYDFGTNRRRVEALRKQWNEEMDIH